MGYFRVADIASTFKNFADKFKDEITYVGSLIALNLSRKLFGRNRAGGKASFLLFLVSLQHALARYKECHGRVFRSCFKAIKIVRISSFDSALLIEISNLNLKERNLRRDNLH